ncbi:hypothetical protein ACFE04_013489 [Oxalis oulophora]
MARLMLGLLERKILPDLITRKLIQLFLASRLRSSYKLTADLQLMDLLLFLCCYIADKSSSLEDAEEAMLEMYCKRAQLQDGHSVLGVGCGWGSLSLYNDIVLSLDK